MSDDLLWKSTRTIVQAGRAMLIIAALGLAIGFMASLMGDDQFFAQLEDSLAVHGLGVSARFGLGIAIALAVLMIVLAERFLSRLAALLAFPPSIDPFQIRNADHLGVMAWLALAIQILGSIMWLLPLEVVAIGSRIKLHDGLSVAGIVLVLLLFVLARIFRHGAEMRSDLEGTV